MGPRPQADPSPLTIFRSALEWHITYPTVTIIVSRGKQITLTQFRENDCLKLHISFRLLPERDYVTFGSLLS